MKRVFFYIAIFQLIPCFSLFSQYYCNEQCYWKLYGNQNGNIILGSNDSSDFYIRTNDINRIMFSADGKIRIFNPNGIVRPTSPYNDSTTLSVAGKISAQKFVVISPRDSAWQWPDNVFEKDYELMNLDELSEFIQKEKHLPEIPSETEIKKFGYDAYKIQNLLIKKLEELTLYVIELNKQNEVLNIEYSLLTNSELPKNSLLKNKKKRKR